LPVMKVTQAFSKYHREPTQIGDKGYVVPNDFYIGGETGDGGGTANMYQRGNLSNGVFHPIAAKNFDVRDPNQFLVTGGPSGHKIQSQDKTTSTVIDALNNIVHLASSAITHTSLGDITHIAAALMTHNARDIFHQAENTITHDAINAINHIAGTSITHAVLNGTLNLVQHNLTIGAPPAIRADPTVPPLPSLPTVMNLIGNLSAFGNIIASGGISAGGGMISGGAPVMTEPVPPDLIRAPLSVTGNSNGNTALISLITRLEELGLILDDTT
ncbi:MAG TPA: hypothetical protein VK890_10990, partial [Bacteroidia bacterium]|nr:hypothetical protein [Bacteroidia bacterium]